MSSEHRREWIVPVFLVALVSFPFVLVMVLFGRGEGVSLGDSVAKQVFHSAAQALYLDSTPQMSHVPLPDEVRGIYWTAVTARSSRGLDLLAYMQQTGLNAVVIDVKMDNGQLIEADAFMEILKTLGEAGIYRIARVAVMRDGAFALEHPEVAMRAPGGGYWYDAIGSLWVDPAAPEVADFAIKLGKEFYAAGFDEIQYDYVRFASDGAIRSIVYPVYDGVESKVEVMQRFFKTVGGAMRESEIPVSFDLFGMTYWSHSDFNIGQRLVDVLPYADFISPMVYPSHYPDGFRGLGNPAENPYEIVYQSLVQGHHLVAGLCACSDEDVAARSRPWLQDFDIGAVYTADLIEAQIQASRDAGASGWILWNARNVYEPANYQ